MSDIDDFETAMASVAGPDDSALKTFDDLKNAYIARLKRMGGRRMDLSKWIPAFSHHVRPLIPGDFMVVLADTGVGKTAVLQSIAVKAAAPLPTIFFEIELSDDVMFERIMCMQARFGIDGVEAAIHGGRDLPNIKAIDHVRFCAKSSLSLADIETIVTRHNATHPEPVAVVVVDYIGLLRDDTRASSRYERLSNIAEQLKLLAKRLDVVMIAASQVHRTSGDDSTRPPQLHSAKDSGSIENSAGLLLGVWREGDGSQMKMQVLKNTRGPTGVTIEAHFDGATMSVGPQYHLPPKRP